jgi:hypothetical protein
VTANLRIIPCSLRLANDFVEAHHRHSRRTARDGGKFALAAVAEAVVVGVAIVGNPLSASLMDGFTAEVLRVCVMDAAPHCTNSFLYGACRRVWFAMGGYKLITYTLLDQETGASLRGAGWRLAATLPGRNPDDWEKYRRQSCVRTPQAITALPKCRWEATNPAQSSLGTTDLDWPIPAISSQGRLAFDQNGERTPNCQIADPIV